MLRPERMSRVSVTGAKRVREDVIETIHELQLLHVTEYDGSWEGFQRGDPVEGADAASQKLVTVRALEATLGVTGDDVTPRNQIVTEEALDEELETVRQDVNSLDDRRDELRDELRAVEERIDTMEPFVALGIDLDLLGGYDSLSVRVGEGDPNEVDAALADGGIDAYGVYSGDGVVAAFAHADEERLQDALVGTAFTAIEVPDGEGDPEAYLEELRHRKQQLESKLTTVEEDIEDLKLEVGGFLLAAEEELTIEVQKREAPLTFATTENAFVAEGWIPTDRVDEMERALADAVGDHVEFSELERADYDSDGHVVDHEEVRDEPGIEQPAAADGAGGEEISADAGEAGDERARADGGTVTMGADDPPVIQNNPDSVEPFEALVEIINRPKYTEFDPTVVFFLTFPAFFGFMIGDVGYGILYILIGAGLMRAVDSDGLRSLGGVAVWAGIFTTVFGVLYGEIFGFHTIGAVLFGGHPPMEKGLSPATVEFAQTWLVVSLLAGLAHLTIGYVLGFVKELGHGVKPAILEKGSWVLMMGGIWAFIFSSVAATMKPAFLFSVFGGEGLTNPATGAAIESHQVAYGLGFTGFPEALGFVGLALFFLGLVLLAMGDFVEVVEFLNVLVNVLSYTRIAAVLLAKAGMAFVVNLLVFGVWTEETGHGAAWHFGTGGMPAEAGVTFHGYEVAEIMFPGVWHAGVAGVVVGLLILVIGHLLVLALGITSAGLQGVRLEYVEFFGKFYEGGGKSYTPFGHEREYTSE
jgi:V/A-type H+-transporting ATPase subunit I